MATQNNFVENFKLNKMINQHLYAVRNKRIKPNTKGSYSYCYFFGDYVILKNIGKIDVEQKGEMLENDFEKRKKFFNELKQRENVNIPEYCCCYKGKHHFYLIQGRAKGNVLSVFYPSTARAITFKTDVVLDNNNTTEELAKEERVQPYEQAEIGYGMYLYNVNMQKQLKVADQKLFDKFVRDFKILVENGVSIDVSRSENFLFDRTEGFSCVDLDMQQQCYTVPSDFVIAKMIFSAFADYKTYLQYMNVNQAKIILNNADVVNGKVFKGIINNKFNLSREEQNYLEEKTRLAKQEFSKFVKGRWQ